MVKIWPNTGQIAGIATNPRLIKDHRFEKLVQSIKDHPEMLEMRECIVVPYADEYVAIAGNMRLRATLEAAAMSDDEFAELITKKQNLENFNDWLETITRLRETREIPCKIIPRDATIEQIKAYIIKDNIGFGEHDYDLLANEWDEDELSEWGLELPNWEEMEAEDEKEPKAVSARLTIEFGDDLTHFDEIKARVKDIIEEFKGVILKD